MNPCIEFCHIRHGKEYSKECDDYCDYAKAVKNYKGVIDRVLEIMRESTKDWTTDECNSPMALHFAKVYENIEKLKGGE